MSTKNQVLRYCRKKKQYKTKTAALLNNPQLKGVCIKVLVVNPKKPNSALRKVAKVRLSTGKEVMVGIPGESHNLSKHSVVLIRGGRSRDVPGLRYKVIRGVLDCDSVSTRSTKRSKYGCKKV